MTTWKSNLKVFIPEMDYDLKAIRAGVAAACYDSIVNGVGPANAPGQPDDLRRGEWKIVEGKDETTIGTSDKSAKSVEDGVSYKYGKPLTKLHSEIGGFHSVKLTHQNAERIIAPVVLRVVGKGNA